MVVYASAIRVDILLSRQEVHCIGGSVYTVTKYGGSSTCLESSTAASAHCMHMLPF